MTTPTQAQIEFSDAEKKELQRLCAGGLTAMESYMFVLVDRIERTAAAQVGEPIATAEMYDNRVNEIVAARQKEIETTTIERCKWAVENVEIGTSLVRKRIKKVIIAALDKVKDET